MEVCVDSVTSAINAEKGGATRLELCANLTEGGTTPSIGLLQEVKRKVSIPVFVMIRPRAGDFLYTVDDLNVMKADITVAKKHAADGIVFGVLTQNGTIDQETTKELIAFDVTCDPISALKTLIALGCERVLTSGQQPTAMQGAELIAQLVDMSNGKLIVMPGSGINAENIAKILKITAATEFHCSARAPRESAMVYRNNCVSMGKDSTKEYQWLECNVNVVQEIKTNATMV